MRQPAVDDMGLARSALQRAEAGLHLRYHATGNDAIPDVLPGLCQCKRRDKARLVVVILVDALDIREQQQLFSLERSRDLRGNIIGIDVVALPACADANRRNDRCVAAIQQILRIAVSTFSTSPT